MTEHLDADQRQLLLEKVLEINDDLVTQSINISGQAFWNALKLGCGILLLPVIIILVVSYVADKFSLISIFVYAGIGAMLAVAFASLVASRAKTLAIRDDEGLDVFASIDNILKDSGFTREEFDALAEEILGEASPLREYLNKEDVGETNNV